MVNFFSFCKLIGFTTLADGFKTRAYGSGMHVGEVPG